MRPVRGVHTQRMRNALFTSQPPSQEDKRHYLSLCVVAQQQQQQQLALYQTTVGIATVGIKHVLLLNI